MFQLESEAASAAPAAEGGGGGVARERIDAHPAKMVTRAWYAANKHIFPASKWEPFSEDTHYPQDDAV